MGIPLLLPLMILLQASAVVGAPSDTHGECLVEAPLVKVMPVAGFYSMKTKNEGEREQTGKHCL
jgi:hypothetical protein